MGQGSSAHDTYLHHYYTRIRHYTRGREDILISYGTYNKRVAFFVFDTKSAVKVDRRDLTKGSVRQNPSVDSVRLRQTLEMRRLMARLLGTFPKECASLFYMERDLEMDGFIEAPLGDSEFCELYPFFIFRLNDRLDLDIVGAWSVFPSLLY